MPQLLIGDRRIKYGVQTQQGTVGRTRRFATALRGKAEALNVTIAAFNRGVEPLSRAVGEALNDYNGILETARTLAGSISETAQEAFDAKSERWQDSEKGIGCEAGSSSGK